MRRIFGLQVAVSWCFALATPTLRRNLRLDFSAAQAGRGRGGVPAGLTRGRKEVGQVAKEEELDRQGSDTDTSLDSDDNTMVAWEEEEESE